MIYVILRNIDVVWSINFGRDYNNYPGPSYLWGNPINSPMVRLGCRLQRVLPFNSFPVLHDVILLNKKMLFEQYCCNIFRLSLSLVEQQKYLDYTLKGYGVVYQPKFYTTLTISKISSRDGYSPCCELFPVAKSAADIRSCSRFCTIFIACIVFHLP